MKHYRSTLESKTISDNWKPFKNDEKSFFIMLKALFFLDIFTFLSWLFGYVENWLEQLDKISLKIFDFTAGRKIIEIQILPNISRSKGNQAMKFGQLIKLNLRNIFSQKSCKKWGRDTSSRPPAVNLKKLFES